MAPPIIEIRDLVKTYKGHRAVDGVSLDVLDGEIFGILGPNGAGKTTTLEMIEGLRTPDSGSIKVKGFDAVREADKVRQIIGVQLQSTSLLPFLSAQELLELFGHFYGITDPAARASELLAQVGLTEKSGNAATQLSGGQQQRLGIALALVNAPAVTFLDEPTTGLDPIARRNLWQTIETIRADGTTVVLTTHYMDEAQTLCDRIAIMDHGQVIACDTPDNLIRSLPQDAVVSARASQDPPFTESDVQALAGVTSATMTSESGMTTIRAATANVQDTIVALLDLAERHHVRLDNLASTSANLEDVFLAMTGRVLSEEGDGQHQPTTRKRRFGRGGRS